MTKYSKVLLMQLEQNDLTAIKPLLNNLRVYLQEHQIYTTEMLNGLWEKQLGSTNCYSFSIKGVKEGGYNLTPLGFCMIQNIDWVSRNGQIFFVMYGGKSTIPNTEEARVCLGKLITFGFDELGLNKLWVEIVEGNNAEEIISEFGFVAEGVRKESVFKKGKFVNTTIYSLLAKEYREHV